MSMSEYYNSRYPYVAEYNREEAADWADAKMTNGLFWDNLFCPHGYDRDPYIKVWFATRKRDVQELVRLGRKTSPIRISVDDGVGWNFVVCVLDLENEFNVKAPGDGATLQGFKLDEVVKVWRKIDELKKHDYEELRKKAMI